MPPNVTSEGIDFTPYSSEQLLGSVYIQDSHLAENMIQDSGCMEVSMNGSTGTE